MPNVAGALLTTRLWPVLALCCALLAHEAAAAEGPPQDAGCARVVTADIVAFEQAYLLNRFGAYVPGGMLFALRDDVVPSERDQDLRPGQVRLRDGKRPRPLVLRANEGDCLEVRFENLLSPTWAEEGGIPREDGGRLPAGTGTAAGTPVPNGRLRPDPVSIDMPRTRAASFHITGLELVPIAPEDCPVGAACGGTGMNAGAPGRQGVVFNPAMPLDAQAAFHGSLALPAQRLVTRWRARREGTYFAYSAGATVGGEGDGGQVALGLFAAVNVEPAGSAWYRSQVTHADLHEIARPPVGEGRHEYAAIDYAATRTRPDGRAVPVLAMLDADNRIVHGDLNAVVVLPETQTAPGAPDPCAGAAFGATCGRSFREFTVVMHDEVPARQAFAELEDEDNPLSNIRDGMGINYGVSSMGALVAGTPLQRATGPARNCPECRAEEFFLSSWANGDPALILDYRGDTPIGARYADDPSNVHHAYLGDAVRFRNLHAGPKETHVFHLHAHQWVMDTADPESTYLDSQTISPGATFSYQIEFGGAGNRNYTVGDSIFHCHLYPHFAQGMWELWRVHDTFEDGRPGPRPYRPAEPAGPDNDPRWRNLPDGEIAAGTATPALVPIPGAALAPLPTAAMPGYPFYIPGEPGHRPPQPALDMDVLASAGWEAASGAEPPDAAVVHGGLPRHVVTSGTLRNDTAVRERALERGGEAAQVIAQRVARQDDPKRFAVLAAEWESVALRTLPHGGTAAERAAMAFHEGSLATPGLAPVEAAAPAHPPWWPTRRAYRTDTSATIATLQQPREGPGLFFVNGLSRAPGAPFANPCPEGAPQRDYRAAFIQTELVYNRHGWFDPQGRIIVLEDDIKDIVDPETRTRLPEPLFIRANSGECVVFRSTNLVPSALNVDDFQILTPTDTLGQHIHLVKFDVTSSDGSGNGWNYEDGTFSPEEVRERIFAHNRAVGPAGPRLELREHPLFRPGGTIHAAAQRDPGRYGPLLERGRCPSPRDGEAEEAYRLRLNRENPWCGAQRTTQRWWADPILSRRSGRDNTLRTVFTHDHFGPSSHQQHGLYAALVIEPANSLWLRAGETVTPQEVALLPDPAGAPLDLAAQQECADRARVLAERPPAQDGAASPEDPIADPARRARCKLLGGSDLTVETTAALRRDTGHPLSPIEPRAALRLRGDGGPTAAFAAIIAPDCIGDSNSSRLQPDAGRNPPDPAATGCVGTQQTRREFALAFADFGIAYNAALEPINPEPRGDSMLRDASLVRFGRRHVATTPARPLGISSEDPGSQYVNYRHEPLALRLAEAVPDPMMGGFDYRQARQRADLLRPCLPGQPDCLGDAANAFSTRVHAERDARLARTTLPAVVTRATREALRGTPHATRIDPVLAAVERWRRDFNCALYPASLLGRWSPADSPEARAGLCDPRIQRTEPWRVFGDPATPILPAHEGDRVQIRLIQGAQEAQHIFTMNGVKWHRQPDSPGSGFTNAQPLGISEHFEFDVVVNPFGARHVDYLYFGSSVDQLWDGMWGVMRSYARPDGPDAPPEAPPLARDPDPRRFVAPLGPPPPRLPGADRERAVCRAPTDGSPTPYRVFDVSAVRACDLHGDCDGPEPGGIEYSSRFGIRDGRGLVYVLNEERACEMTAGPAGPSIPCEQAPQPRSNADVLRALRSDFAAGRPLEPLVLRAPAGACLDVTLRNHLPVSLGDGPGVADDGTPREVEERAAYHNFLPMIADGFNVNQIRTSSSVGLSAPRVAQNPLAADGSNVGLNGALVDASTGGWGQGSLLPPCPPRQAGCGLPGNPGQRRFFWSATDYERRNEPVELGALPLRSFGDPIRHPMHGLGGALVIGPEGSEVCGGNRFATRFPPGVSAEICTRDGGRYVDHVLMVQDAVNAQRGGMPVGNLAGAEEPDDYGAKALNYRTEPLWARRGDDPTTGFENRGEMDYADALSAAALPGGQRCAAGILPSTRLPPERACDPETPVLTARPGETVRLHVVHPGGHTRQQGLAVAGHGWNPFPWSAAEESRVFDAGRPDQGIRQGVFNGFGPMMGISLQLTAGGEHAVAMDYLIRSQASFLFDGGLWGLLRVGEAAAPGAGR